MEILEVILLPVIILLGIITSYEDIKYGKIRNKWIISALICGFLAYLSAICWYFFAGEVNWTYILELLTNLLFAVAVGFGLWYYKIWTAGDGKLFIAFALLVPFSFYKNSYYAWTPSLALIVNIFTLGLLIMAILVVYKSTLKDWRITIYEMFANFFRPTKLLKSAVTLFAVFWVITLLFSWIGLTNVLIRYVFTLLLSSIVESKNKSLYFTVPLVLVRLFLDDSVYTWAFLKGFLVLVLIMRFITSSSRSLFPRLGQNVLSKKMSLKELREGMILNETIMRKDKVSPEYIEKVKEQNGQVIKFKGHYYIKRPKEGFELNDYLGGESEGLTLKHIKELKKIGFKDFQVAQTVPFAPFIFLGVVLTIMLRGSIILFLKSLSAQ